MKKIFTLLTLALMSISAWASTVDDLKTIATDYVFIADDITSNGTVKLTANTLYDGNVIFAPTANTVAINKGNSTIEGVNHLNSLRLKNTQDQLCFKVSGACTVTFYTESKSDRGINVGSSEGGTQYGVQTASTTEWSCNITAAGVVYLSSYGKDFYFAGFKVTFPKTGQPTISTNPVSTEYSQGEAATALSVSATAAGSGALSYQWYKNETNQSVLAGEAATEIDGATNATYTPSTATAGTIYYFCKVTEEGNANVATTRMAKVVVSPTGYDVTYSLGEVTGIVGTLPANESAVVNVTIPVNKTLYKDGYTLTAWNDGSADHAIGDVVALSGNTTFTPVFTANDASTYLGHNASTATWNFNNNTGAPTWAMEGSGTFVYVTQTSVGGNSMDLMMNMDATGGKIYSNGDWTQINANSKLTVPVIVGAVVKVYVYSDAAAPTFNGNDGTYDSSKKIYSYTATADGDLDIVYGGNDYASKVTVDYPSESALLTVTANDTKIGLTKTSIEAVDYLTVSPTDKWGSTKTYATDYTGQFFNMSNGRELTITVTGANTFEVFVQNDGSATRSYKLKVGDADDVVVSCASSSLTASGVYTLDPTATTTIKLTGNGDSVYPVYFHFDPTATITPAKEYTTYVTTNALDFTGLGIKAYVATAASATAVTLAEVTTVPAGTPLVLEGTAGDVYNVPVIASATAPASNLLVAGDGVTEIGGTTKYDYVLKDGLFYRADAGVLPVGKAYLHLEADPATSRGMELSLDFGGGVTGISEIEDVRSKKDDVYYDLNGRRVLYPTKGLYIVNGKKIIMK